MDTAIIFMGRRAILAAVLKRGASEAHWAGILQARASTNELELLMMAAVPTSDSSRTRG